MSRIKLVFWVLMVGSVAFGQEERVDIIPPSPEATSLAKFTEIPVNHYTGIPNINVPLYEIDFDGLKIPISLSYHARGIKVEEIASRVGIGWALNAGGIITRQVRGKNDFGEYGYLNSNYYERFDLDYNVRDSLWGTTLGELDLIPDQFIFNFLGNSGKFIFDQQTKLPVLQGYSDLKIESMGNSGSSLYFIITTENGFKFYFGEKETPDSYKKAKSKDVTIANYMVNGSGKLVDVASGLSTDYVNTWHLMNIVSPNGEKISFNYIEENPVFYRRAYDKIKGGVPSSYFSQYRGKHFQLKEIVFNQGAIKFIKNSTKRNDLKNGYALSSIEIKNRHKRIKKYNFNYSYSYNNSPNNITPYLYKEDFPKKRLFLDSIQMIDNNNNAELYRSFEYTDKKIVPNRFSNEQDYWGYYNGKNNGFFLTNFSYSGYTVNREVDTIKTKVGLIKKMTYPTKGYTSYIFEVNKAIIPDYFKDLYYANPNPTTKTRYASLRKDRITRVSDGVYENAFEIKESDIGPITVRVRFSGDALDCKISQLNGYTNSSCRYRVYVVHAGSGNLVTMDGIPLRLHSLSDGSSYTMPIENLPPGNYKIRVETLNGADDPNDYENGFSVYLNWYEQVQNEHKNLIYSGGNRIKKIENYSNENGKITRTYEYFVRDRQHATRSNISSGLLFSLPNYYYKTSKITLPNGVEVPVLDSYGARPGSPLSYEQGNHVGYSHVTEYIDSGNLKGESGKIEYEFTAMPDGGEFYKFPYTLPVNNEWLRGKPLLIKYYAKDKNNLTNYSISKSEEFIYKYADELRETVLTNPFIKKESATSRLNYVNNRLKFYRPLIKFTYWGWNENLPVGPNNYRIYYLTGGVQKLFRKKETTFTDGIVFSKTTNFFYNYDKHYQKVGSKTTGSDGKTIANITTFVNELAGPTAAEKKLVQQHRIATPIESKSFLHKENGDSLLLSAQKNEYKIWNDNAVALKAVKTTKGSNASSNNFEDRIVYHRYDSHANPLEISQKDGPHTVYLYGYTHQYPIAKIENATFSEVARALGVSEAALEGFNENQVGQINGLRAKKPEWMITTYTHIPLVGMETVTDPKGLTTTYEYDGFNRLQYIKDHNSDILEAYEYNYRTE